MGQIITCACGKRLIVKDSFAGSAVRCPKCGEVIPLDDGDSEPINVPGIHRQSSRSRRRRSNSWYVPVGITVGAILVTVALSMTIVPRAVDPSSPASNVPVAGPATVTGAPAVQMASAGRDRPASDVDRAQVAAGDRSPEQGIGERAP